MKKSNCCKKYGKEWSPALVQATRDHFESMFAGYVKHIGDRDGRYAIDMTFISRKKYESLIPEAEREKRVFLFSFSKFELLKDPEGMVFDIAYDSIDEMIDDGWALD